MKRTRPILSGYGLITEPITFDVPYDVSEEFMRNQSCGWVEITDALQDPIAE